MKNVQKRAMAIALGMLSIFAFGGCADSTNDVSDGKIEVIAISEAAYADVEQTMEAYVAKEVKFVLTDYYPIDYEDVDYDDGTWVTATYMRHEKRGDVALEDIRQNGVWKKGATAAEKYAVTSKFILDWSRYGDYSDIITQTVYVLRYGDGLRYMVSVPEMGERASNSYAVKISGFQNYVNCTFMCNDKVYNSYDGNEQGNLIQKTDGRISYCHFSGNNWNGRDYEEEDYTFYTEDIGWVCVSRSSKWIDKELEDIEWSAYAFAADDPLYDSLGVAVDDWFCDVMIFYHVGVSMQRDENGYSCIFRDIIDSDYRTYTYTQSCVLKNNIVAAGHFRCDYIDESSYIQSEWTISDVGTTKIELPQEVQDAVAALREEASVGA